MTSHLLTVALTACLDPRKIRTNILWNEIFFLSCMTHVRDYLCPTYVWLHFFKYFKILFSRFPSVHVSRTFDVPHVCVTISRTWLHGSRTLVSFLINLVASVSDHGLPHLCLWCLTYIINSHVHDILSHVHWSSLNQFLHFVHHQNLEKFQYWPPLVQQPQGWYGVSVQARNFGASA